MSQAQLQPWLKKYLFLKLLNEKDKCKTHNNKNNAEEFSRR